MRMGLFKSTAYFTLGTQLKSKVSIFTSSSPSIVTAGNVVNLVREATFLMVSVVKLSRVQFSSEEMATFSRCRAWLNAGRFKISCVSVE